MNLQKEREAFLDIYKYYPSAIKFTFDVENECFILSKKNPLDREVEVMSQMNQQWWAWLRRAKLEYEKLKGCVVVPVELSESIAEKLALEKVEKPRQENDVVWQEIADRSYKDHLIQKKWEIIRNYKELVEAVRGGNE